MTRHHEEWTDLLSADIDGELDPVTRRRLRDHLAGCAECSRVRDDLSRIVAAAPRYRGAAPSEEVWSGVAAAIGHRPVTPLARYRRVARGYPLRQLIAAGLVMALAGAGVTWAVLGGRAAVPAPVVALTPEEPTEVLSVSNADAASYDRAVSDLEETLAANRTRLDTATVRVLEASLSAIDRAIAEARAAIQRDSTNAYLNGQIAANLRKKVNLLRLATRAMASET